MMNYLGAVVGKRGMSLNTSLQRLGLGSMKVTPTRGMLGERHVLNLDEAVP